MSSTNTPKCAKCNKKIIGKRYLICCVCKHSYDLPCVNKEKLYNLMDKQRRDAWTCNKCLEIKKHQKKTSTPIIKKNVHMTSASGSDAKIILENPRNNVAKAISPVPLSQQHGNLMDNVTVRKYNIPIQNSFESLSDEDSSDLSVLQNDTMNRSCPNISTHNYKDELAILKVKVTQLQEKLATSDSYITKLLVENDNLTKQVSECYQQIENLKSICKSTTKVNKHVKSFNNKKHQSTLTDDFKVTDSSMRKLPLKQQNVEQEEDKENCIQNDNHSTVDTLGNTSDQTQILLENSTDPKIYILGGEQCRGLALALLKSREKTPYRKYTITSVVKPKARAEHILSSSDVINSNSDDFIIIDVGGNDSNPTKLFTELCFFRKLYSHPHIIVMSVKTNPHLNEKKLNNSLRLLCKNFDRCTYLNLNDIIGTNSYSKYKMCSKINFLIDSIYYDSKYLNCKRLNQNIEFNPHSLTSHPLSEKYAGKIIKQRHITDYFGFKVVDNELCTPRPRTDFFRK